MATSTEELLSLIKSLHNKVDLVIQQNASILGNQQKQVEKKLGKRCHSSRRGLGKKDIDMQLSLLTPPSSGFFEWVDSVQRGLNSSFIAVLQSCDKFEKAIFGLLQGAYLKDSSPIFSVKMDKNNYIWEAGSYRLMNESDMKRVILLFQCRVSGLLDDWYNSLIPDDSVSDELSDRSGTEIHFHKKMVVAEVDKVNKLILCDNKVLRTLLRKLNTHMLSARGIVFEGRRRSSSDL